MPSGLPTCPGIRTGSQSSCHGPSRPAPTSPDASLASPAASHTGFQAPVFSSQPLRIQPSCTCALPTPPFPPGPGESWDLLQQEAYLVKPTLPTPRGPGLWSPEVTEVSLPGLCTLGPALGLRHGRCHIHSWTCRSRQVDLGLGPDLLWSGWESWTCPPMAVPGTARHGEAPLGRAVSLPGSGPRACPCAWAVSPGLAVER